MSHFGREFFGVVRGDFPAESDFFKTPEASIRGQLDKMLKPAAAH